MQDIQVIRRIKDIYPDLPILFIKVTDNSASSLINSTESELTYSDTVVLNDNENEMVIHSLRNQLKNLGK